jgi:S1-C subfamily serine protease
MKIWHVNILLIFFICFFSASLTAQQKLEIKTDGNTFLIRETGAMLVEENDKLKIEMVLPPEQRPKGYADVDMEKGDMILMMNGKRVNTTDQARQIYDGLKEGEDVKLGITRGEQMFISSFKKADEKNLPQMKRMIVTNDGGEIKPLPELGMILGTKGKKIEILDMMENAESVLKTKELTEGDELISLNGKLISSLKSFSDEYDKLKIGSKIELKFGNNGKSKIITVNKPEPKGNVIIKKESK